MPKKNDSEVRGPRSEVRARAVRLVADHLGEYPSPPSRLSKAEWGIVRGGLRCPFWWSSYPAQDYSRSVL